jgi:hypothetical protein
VIDNFNITLKKGNEFLISSFVIPNTTTTYFSNENKGLEWQLKQDMYRMGTEREHRESWGSIMKKFKLVGYFDTSTAHQVL